MCDWIVCYTRRARRFKFPAALALMFLSGWLLSMGTSSWHYDRIMMGDRLAAQREVARLTDDVDMERDVNRMKLTAIARQSAANAEQLEYIVGIAKGAAATAQSAATTANGAARNAANANIRVAPAPKNTSPFTNATDP